MRTHMTSAAVTLSIHVLLNSNVPVRRTSVPVLRAISVPTPGAVEFIRQNIRVVRHRRTPRSQPITPVEPP